VSSAPSLAWSGFARERYRRGRGHAWFDGDEQELLDLVRAHWDARRPGDGRTDLELVVVVPVPPDRFRGATVNVAHADRLTARLVRRQPQEDPYVEVLADGPPEPVHHAAVVLYSAAALLQNGGERTTDADWEVVCLIASPVDPEPMDPLTMARNMLARPGGTPCTYTAEQFAAAVWYWAGRVKAHPRD